MLSGAAGPAGATDPNDATRALGVSGLLRAFCDAGVLEAADVHVASLLGRLVECDEQVLLAAALAVRALRLGSVCVDLTAVGALAGADAAGAEAGSAQPGSAQPGSAEAGSAEAGAGPGPSRSGPLLECPDPGAWLEALRSSDLVGVEEPAPAGAGLRPLHLSGSLLYLDRYWRDEELIAEDLLRRAGARPAVDPLALGPALNQLFPPVSPGASVREPPGTGGSAAVPGATDAAGGADLQAVAAACGVLGGLTVLSGGPGTGKTTTVARLLALLHEQSPAASARPPLVALCAPTGKAAARMRQAVQEEAQRLAGSGGCDEATRAWLDGLTSSTLHRLLGSLPSTTARFRHNRRNRLPHDVVVVDEASMVPLALMARLLEAVKESARLVLVGDHEQLASVEAGSVLGDIVGPAAEGLRFGRQRLAALQAVTARPHVAPGADEDADEDADASADGPGIGDCVVVLRRVHRFGGSIAELAAAVQGGDAERVMSVLRRGDDAVSFVELDPLPAALARLDEVAALAAEAGRSLLSSASASASASASSARSSASSARLEAADVAGAAAGTGKEDRHERGLRALEALGRFRLLCANRRGPYGVAAWQQVVESWMRAGAPGFSWPETLVAGRRWYPGLPLLVVANDYELGLFNGDAGVVVDDGDGRLAAVFESAGPATRYGLDRLGEVERCFATTVHKSQGSQFASVAVVLPAGDSPILTRELLYTAVTRASERVVVVAEERSVRAAVSRPIARASGLRARLWRDP